MKPGTSALVESVRNRSTPSSPSRAKPRRSVIRLSRGNWSILKSPVCSTRPAPVRIADGEAVGDRVVDGEELEVEGAEGAARSPSLTSSQLRADPVLLELLVDQRQRQPRPDDRDVGALAQQVGHAADVVLVPVGEDDADDGVEPVPDPAEVGQDHVDAGLVLLGEEHAAVDDEQLARRTRRRSCCDRSRRARRARRPAALGPAASGAAGARDGDGSQGGPFWRVG